MILPNSQIMLNSKKKTYFTLLVILAGVILLFFAGGVLLADKIELSGQEIKNQETLLNRLKGQKKQINQIRKDYKESENGMKTMEELFLDSGKTVDFIIEAENISQKTLVELEIKTLNKGVINEDSPSILNYQLTAEGKFNNVARFLAYLENMKYNVRIDNLKIKTIDSGKRNSSSSTGRIKAAIDLGVYVK